MTDEYKTIKVKKEVYNKLKELGGESLSKSIEDLINAAHAKVSKKLSDARAAADEIAKYLISHGYFDIKLRDAGITKVNVSDNLITIQGQITIHIPNREILNKIINILRDRGVEIGYYESTEEV